MNTIVAESLIEVVKEEDEAEIRISIKLNREAIDCMVEQYGPDYVRMQIERALDQVKHGELILLELIG